jgi:hypothetical protein
MACVEFYLVATSSLGGSFSQRVNVLDIFLQISRFSFVEQSIEISCLKVATLLAIRIAQFEAIY